MDDLEGVFARLRRRDQGDLSPLTKERQLSNGRHKSNYLDNAWANTIRGGGNGTTYTAPAAVYVKLHTGAAGEDGTETLRGTRSGRLSHSGPPRTAS